MKTMTTRERMKCMYEHREADRVPITDHPWGSTLERWHAEGMPESADFVDYFGLDRMDGISLDNSPQYEHKVVEETDEYKITTSAWGATMRNWKHQASTPEFLDFTIVDPESWAKTKERITPARDRVRWNYLEENYERWKKNGFWTEIGFWFGFDVVHSWAVGTERLLMAMAEQPEWCMDMFSHQLETCIALSELMLDAGYEFDAINWCDDMGFKQNQFFSVKMYRELVKPFHKRAVDWAHSKGMYARLHSCGDINPLLPELVDIGLDELNPMEVKAGMDPIHIKKTFGKDLVLHGGLNAMLWDKPEEIRAEMQRVMPVLKESGGYVFSSDHSVPSSVSLDDFKGIIALAKELGSYE